MELQTMYRDVGYGDEEVVEFYAVLCSVSGDNSSSHALAGFVKYSIQAVLLF
jgi:hypothetical protein